MSNQTKPVLKGDIDNLAKQFHKALDHAYKLDDINAVLFQAAPHKILSPNDIYDMEAIKVLLTYRVATKSVLFLLNKPTDLTANQAS